LDLDLVSRKDADVVLAHLSGDRREDVVPAVELHAKHGARQGLSDLPLDLDLLFLARHPLLQSLVLNTKNHGLAPRTRHGTRTCARLVSTRGPSPAIATVCSKWAA